jgi:hypothetical protein
MQLVFENIEGSGEIYLDVVGAICSDVLGNDNCSMLDLMCHHSPYNAQLPFTEKVFVDIQDRPLDFVSEQVNFVQYDVLKFLERNLAEFDVIICSDGIEHLTKRDGFRMLKMMQNQSHKHIIFTPLGEYCLELNPTNDPDAHRSGWEPKEFVGWASIIFTDFHKQNNAGAFFTWHCKDIEKDFERVKNILKDKSWTKLN